MKKGKKLLGIVMAGILTVSGLSACSPANPQPNQKSPQSTTAGQDTAAATEEKSSEPVTLRFAWWGNDDRHERTLKVIAMYQEKNPHVTIEPEYRGKSEREKVATELGSGTSADIVQLNPPWMGDFVTNGDFFVDLSQYSFDLEGFDKNLIENYCTYKGALITLPSGLNARSFLMNKTKLDSLGIKSGLDTAWTWDDIHRIGKTVNEQNPDMYFLNIDKIDMVEFVMRPYMIQKSGKFLIDDNYEIGFTKEELADALAYIAKLYSDGVAVPASEGNTFLNAVWTNPDWINGDLPAMLSWTSLMAGATGDSKDEFVNGQLPVSADAKDTSIVVKPSQLYAVVKTSKHPEVASDFLNFLLTDEEAGKVLGDCRGVPPYKTVQDICMEAGILNEEVVRSTQYAQEKAGLYENAASSNAEIMAVLQDAVENVSYDPSKVDGVVEQSMKLIEDILATLKN